MIVRRVIEADVRHCTECPYYEEERDMGATMSICLKLSETSDWAYGDVLPESRGFLSKNISEKCPLRCAKHTMTKEE